MVTNVQLRLLTGAPEEVDAIQRVLEGAPGYARRVAGRVAGPTEGRELFSALPPGVDRHAKHVYGVVVDRQVVGCLDLIRGWPDERTAHIGLLLLDEDHTGRGLGRAAYEATEDLLRQWPEITCVRASVVATNDVALPFWHAMGLTETGETKPYQHGSVTSHAVVLTRTWPSTSPRRAG